MVACSFLLFLSLPRSYHSSHTYIYIHAETINWYFGCVHDRWTSVLQTVLFSCRFVDTFMVMMMHIVCTKRTISRYTIWFTYDAAEDYGAAQNEVKMLSRFLSWILTRVFFVKKAKGFSHFVFDKLHTYVLTCMKQL